MGKDDDTRSKNDDQSEDNDDDADDDEEDAHTGGKKEVRERDIFRSLFERLWCWFSYR